MVFSERSERSLLAYGKCLLSLVGMSHSGIVKGVGMGRRETRVLLEACMYHRKQHLASQGRECLHSLGDAW